MIFTTVETFRYIYMPMITEGFMAEDCIFATLGDKSQCKECIRPLLKHMPMSWTKTSILYAIGHSLLRCLIWKPQLLHVQLAAQHPPPNTGISRRPDTSLSQFLMRNRLYWAQQTDVYDTHRDSLGLPERQNERWNGNREPVKGGCINRPILIIWPRLTPLHHLKPSYREKMCTKKDLEPTDRNGRASKKNC